MIRRIFVSAVLALAMAGCATTQQAGYTDGSYKGAYNGGYYAAAQDGSGDYYYDRPVVVVNEYGPGYGFYPGFGYGFSTWGYGFSPWYRPWWGGGPWYGWGGWYGWYGWYPHHHGWVAGQVWHPAMRAAGPSHPGMPNGGSSQHQGTHSSSHPWHDRPSH